ncbi:MAG: Lrp/AsnC family transcriptional regulator [Lachnospiraceae bacterium]|jgi:DNA-binding Lrp family transcriptional regulator|nr:Lrp/AsnC family transcriptional regulator [Lachnospiraceae bacterium]MBR2531329.1 Lrp/AsnC family transcriptional regulator [Lachnospiraceae bacterium]
MTEKILTILEKNARIRTDDLANILGEDSYMVRQEVERLESEKVICGYHTLINWDKVGQEKADAFIEVKVAPQRGVGFDQVAERIWQYPEVSSIFLVSGNCDFIVLLQGKSMREIAMFVSEKLATIDGVLSTMTQFILKKYKQDGFVVENPRKDEREAIS